MLDPQTLILFVVVLAAATLQAASGIGFGIIAGPLLLAVINDSSAVFISIVLNLLIAAMLVRSSLRKCDFKTLRILLLGILAGAPIGYFLYANLPLNYLKLTAALFVLLAFALMVGANRIDLSETSPGQVGWQSGIAGFVAGIMGSSLAMPGPVPAALLAARDVDKATVRATILVMFLFAYGLFLIIQLTTSNISQETLALSVKLSIPTALGVLLGHAIAGLLSQRMFRAIIMVVLLATSATLLFGIEVHG